MCRTPNPVIRPVPVAASISIAPDSSSLKPLLPAIYATKSSPLWASVDTTPLRQSAFHSKPWRESSHVAAAILQQQTDAFVALQLDVVQGGKGGVCRHCGKRFAHRSSLTRHLHCHLQTPVHPCNVCGKEFRQKYALTRHQLTHSASKPFQCPDCGRRIRRRDNLRNHMRTHTGVKPFQCRTPGCGKHFRQQSSLTNHMKTHSVAKPYKCPVLWCDKSFKIERILTTIDYAHGLNELPQWKGSYRRHYQTAHNGQSTTQNLILLSS